jgi:serine-type D-Ala-D-Ala carboxypeptidase (penicillin-binding protein 5/6)
MIERQSLSPTAPQGAFGVFYVKTGIIGLRRVSVVALTAGALLTAGAFAVPSAQAATLATPTIVAKGGYVMNNATGTTLFTKGADTRRSTGSTTKIMTARVVLGQKNLDLNARVYVQKAYSDYIVSRGASSAHLVVGDRPTVRQLLYAMMLPSGCDAAYALADHYGVGTTRAARVADFIGKMNTTAGQLHLANTHFDSFDGIGNGSNYSTPRDLTKIAQSAMRFSMLRTVVKTRSISTKVVTNSGGYRSYSWTNTNKLLGTYTGMIGVKTGSGSEAGYCLVFAATRGTKTVIGTVLASTSEANRTADAKKLMDYAFAK